MIVRELIKIFHK